MKIIGINKDGIFNMATEVVTSPQGKTHHNIKFGSKTKGLWRLSYGIDKRVVDPNVHKEPVWLTGSHYILNPVMRQGRQVKDNRGNGIYYITTKQHLSEEEKKDTLAFIELPNNFYRHVQFDLKGNCILIGTGYNGYNIDNVVYGVPYPVVLIKDDMKLTWTGVDKEGKKIRQEIAYIGGEPYISDIKEVNE